MSAHREQMTVSNSVWRASIWGVSFTLSFALSGCADLSHQEPHQAEQRRQNYDISRTLLDNKSRISPGAPTSRRESDEDSESLYEPHPTQVTSELHDDVPSDTFSTVVAKRPVKARRALKKTPSRRRVDRDDLDKMSGSGRAERPEESLALRPPATEGRAEESVKEELEDHLISLEDGEEIAQGGQLASPLLGTQSSASPNYLTQSSSSLDAYLNLGRPHTLWPRRGYFENTYLGGDLSYDRQLREASSALRSLMTQREYHAWSPPLDSPREGGMSLDVNLSHASFERPQRVILQVALKGSERYGWRRPSLNSLIVVDPTLLKSAGVEARHAELITLILPVFKHLNAADQIGLAYGDLLISPRAPSELKRALIQPLRELEASSIDQAGWSRLFKQGEASLERTARDPHRAPGAQAVLLLCAEGCRRHSSSLRAVAHRLNLSGTLMSVIERPSLDALGRSDLWRISAAGHGGYWIAGSSPESFQVAFEREFKRFSRVVARLLRLSVKLGDGVDLIEILGSRMLSDAQKHKVKAREVEMDRRLSERMGIKSDRGEDDEGVQVVIPAFYGGDSHLIHLALWVSAPGEIAEVQLKYKDLVRAQNASASTSARLGARPASLTQSHAEVREAAERHLMASELLISDRGGSLSRRLKRLGIKRRSERQLLARSRLGRPFNQ